ncbi:MAG: hypothetical protein H0T68_01310 [Gemmatimonadales bacterium]|nr:hypothetical protein [Gemmatimonadales bacterium]
MPRDAGARAQCDPQRVLAVASGADFVSLLHQDTLDEAADHRIVFGYEDAAADRSGRSGVGPGEGLGTPRLAGVESLTEEKEEGGNTALRRRDGISRF